MTIIVLAICAAIAALVLAIVFVPGVGSALAMGFGLAFFKTLAENRQKRVAIRQERWRLRRGRGREPETPSPAEPPVEPPGDSPDTDRRVRLLQRRRGRRGDA